MSLGNKPGLKDAFKELLHHATYWKSIGTLLNLPEHVIQKIKSDEDNAEDRLQTMLSEWLKRGDNTQTWNELADAVELIDRSKAQEIRERYVHDHAASYKSSTE